MTRAMAHFFELRQEIAHGKYASDEIAAALSWSPFTASGAVSAAVDLVERLPDTVAEVESGKLDMTKARAILEWTETLPVDQARQVAAGVHDWSVGRTASALRQKLSREVAKVDPDALEARRRDRARHRKVSFYPNPDGMATLASTAPADRTRALHQLLDHLARQAKAAGDPRTLDALRTDALFEICSASTATGSRWSCGSRCRPACSPESATPRAGCMVMVRSVCHERDWGSWCRSQRL